MNNNWCYSHCQEALNSLVAISLFVRTFPLTLTCDGTGVSYFFAVLNQGQFINSKQGPNSTPALPEIPLATGLYVLRINLWEYHLKKETCRFWHNYWDLITKNNFCWESLNVLKRKKKWGRDLYLHLCILDAYNKCQNVNTICVTCYLRNIKYTAHANNSMLCI